MFDAIAIRTQTTAAVLAWWKSILDFLNLHRRPSAEYHRATVSDPIWTSAIPSGFIAVWRRTVSLK